MAVRTFGGCHRGGQHVSGGGPLLGLQLSPPLLLPEELLRLEEDPGVDVGHAREAVAGALVAGVTRIVLGRLEDLPRRVRLFPRVLRDGAGILPGLATHQNKPTSSH